MYTVHTHTTFSNVLTEIGSILCAFIIANALTFQPYTIYASRVTDAQTATSKQQQRCTESFSSSVGGGFAFFFFKINELSTSVRFIIFFRSIHICG